MLAKSKNVTVNHFFKEKIPRETIYSIIEKYEESDHVGEKPRSGRLKKLCRGRFTRLKRLVNHKTGVALRRLASKFRVSQQTIRTYLEEMNINYYKKMKEIDVKVIQAMFSGIRKQLRKSLIMDDIALVLHRFL